MHEVHQDIYALSWLLGVSGVVGVVLVWFSRAIASWLQLIDRHKRAARIMTPDQEDLLHRARVQAIDE